MNSVAENILTKYLHERDLKMKIRFQINFQRNSSLSVSLYMLHWIIVYTEMKRGMFKGEEREKE